MSDNGNTVFNGPKKIVRVRGYHERRAANKADRKLVKVRVQLDDGHMVEWPLEQAILFDHEQLMRALEVLVVAGRIDEWQYMPEVCAHLEMIGELDNYMPW